MSKKQQFIDMIGQGGRTVVHVLQESVTVYNPSTGVVSTVRFPDSIKDEKLEDSHKRNQR